MPLVPAQLTLPSGVAVSRALPATYLVTYAGYPRSGCGPVGRALPCSFLGAARRSLSRRYIHERPPRSSRPREGVPVETYPD